MPHKRNPVICERICGLSRILRGNALAGMENVCLWHERDISHSSAERVIFPDSTLALDYILQKFIQVLAGLQVYPENMLANLVRTRGLIFSQRVLLKLMDKGLMRQKAYGIVQRNAMRAWKGQADFKANLSADLDVRRCLRQKEIEEIFQLDYYLRNVNRIFKRLKLK